MALPTLLCLLMHTVHGPCGASSGNLYVLSSSARGLARILVVMVLCRHYVNQTAHPQFDPLERRDSVLSAAFYDQMVVLVRLTFEQT